MKFLECLQSAGKVLHGNNYLWSMMKKSSISRTQRFMYSQILCYVMDRWIRTQHQILIGNSSWIESKIHHNTELWTQLTESRWNSSGIFCQNSPHYSSSTKSMSSWTKWGNQNNSKAELSSCRCWMTSYGELKTLNGNALLTPHLWLYLQSDFGQDVGHSSDLDQKSSGTFLTTKDHKENGTESLNWWWSNSEKADTQFSESRVHYPEECSEAKEVENYQYTSVPMGIRLKLFRTIISVNQLSICGAVSDVCEEYDTCQTNTVRPVLAEQSDPLFASAILLMVTPKHSVEIPAQEILWQEYKVTTRSIDQNLYWCRIPETSWKSDNTSRQSTLTSSYNLQIQWHVVSTLCQEMNNQLTQKVAFEGTSKLDPSWKSQPVSYLQGNMEWKWELNLWTKTILTRVSEFLTDWTSWSRTRSTESTTSSETLKRRRNAKVVSLLTHLSELYLFLERTWILVEPGSQFDQAYPVPKDWTLFFDTENYLEKKMERSNSGDWKKKQETETTRKYFNTVLTCKDKKIFTSDLFKVIQDAIPLILHCRTTC